MSDSRRRGERGYQLRLAGMSYQAIADSPDPVHPDKTLFADKAGAWKAIKAARDRHLGAVETEELRLTVLGRYEAMIRAIWPKVLSGDVAAQQTMQRTLLQLTDLMGVKLPVKQVVEVITEHTVDLAIGDLARQIAELAGDEPVPAEMP